MAYSIIFAHFTIQTIQTLNFVLVSALIVTYMYGEVGKPCVIRWIYPFTKSFITKTL